MMRSRSAMTTAVALGAVLVGLVTGAPASAGPEKGRPLTVEFRGEATLPAGMQFEGTTVGGLSSITYDSAREVYYVISDDQAGVRFYTLAIDVSDGTLDPGDVTVLDVTTLEAPAGETYAPGTVDPEGLALTRDDTLVVTSEGVPAAGVAPWVREYTLDGEYLRDLTVPDAFVPGPGQGVRTNLGFESAAVAPNGQFLFTGNEGALVQDGPAATPTNGSQVRLLRYRLSTGQVDRTYLYDVDPVAAEPVPAGSFSVNGLVELLALDPQHLLAMERSFSVGVGNDVTLYRVALAGRDGSAVTKTELIDLGSLGLTLDNLEGMTFGPRLDDGRRALIIVSDNNFTPGQVSQFLMLAVR